MSNKLPEEAREGCVTNKEPKRTYMGIIYEHIKSKQKRYTRKWEPIDISSIRLKIFGGWLVRCYNVENYIEEGNITFVPDPKHEWILEDK